MEGGREGEKEGGREDGRTRLVPRFYLIQKDTVAVSMTGGREGGREGAYLRGTSADGLVPLTSRGGLAVPTHVVGGVLQVARARATEARAARTGDFQTYPVAYLGREGRGEGGRGHEMRRGDERRVRKG